MTERRKIQLPLTEKDIAGLRAGDAVLLSGPVITGRDAAHKRMTAALAAGEPLPVSLQGETIYYAGPTPTPPDRVIGSVGPTTSGRMDPFTPAILDCGLKGMIGKGQRSPAVIEAMVQHGVVYFAALGGAGALIAQCIKEVSVIAYPDLGCEAMRRLVVEDLPVIVAVDSLGNDLYRSGREEYAKNDVEFRM